MFHCVELLCEILFPLLGLLLVVMATTAKTKEEPYYPDGGYGWVIVGAVILINVSL